MLFEASGSECARMMLMNVTDAESLRRCRGVRLLVCPRPHHAASPPGHGQASDAKPSAYPRCVLISATGSSAGSMA